MYFIKKIKSLITNYFKSFYHDITSSQPNFILPDGYTLTQIYDFVLSIAVDKAPKDELKKITMVFPTLGRVLSPSLRTKAAAPGTRPGHDWAQAKAPADHGREQTPHLRQPP